MTMPEMGAITVMTNAVFFNRCCLVVCPPNMKTLVSIRSLAVTVPATLGLSAGLISEAKADCYAPRDVGVYRTYDNYKIMIAMK